MKVLTLTVLVACAYSQFKPTSIQAPPDAFAKASRVLIDRGESVETKDEAAGVLITKWEDTVVMDLKRRYRWKVSTNGGTLTVDSQCQEFAKNTLVGGGDWKDCVTQPDDRSANARLIADAIANAPPGAQPAAAVQAVAAPAEERKEVHGDKPLFCASTTADSGLCFLDEAACGAEATKVGAPGCEKKNAGSCFSATKTLDATKQTVCAVSIKDCDARRERIAADADYGQVSPCGVYRVK